VNVAFTVPEIALFGSMLTVTVPVGSLKVDREETSGEVDSGLLAASDHESPALVPVAS